MKKRIIGALVILTGFFLLIGLSEYIVYPIGLGILSAMAVYEIFKVFNMQSQLLVAIPAYILSAALPIGAYFTNYYFSGKSYLLIVGACILVYLLYLMGVSVFSKDKTSFSSISETFVILTYVAVSFTSLSMLRYIDKNGLFLVILVFIIAWLCDAFAFFVGSLIGRHKLIPEISPKKTVEGAVGGVILTAATCLLYGLLLDYFVKDIAVNYIVLLIYGLVLSVVAQLGDLIASLIKRERGVKDYGDLIPGHGGITDRFDSVFPVSSLILVLVVVFPPFISA